MKVLYEFTIEKTQEVEKTESSVNEAGEEVKISKKVTEKVPHKFCLQKPSRALLDEADLFYSVTVSKGVQAGLLSAALLAKRFSNDGGILSEPEKEEWAKTILDRLKKETELQRISMKIESERTDEEKASYDTLVKEIATLNRDLMQMEIGRQSLFDITAESRARTRSIFWWLLFLLHKESDKKEWVPFFEGEEFKEKLESYDDIEDEDKTSAEDKKFNASVVEHAISAVALWYYGRASNQEEFKAAITEQTK